MSQQATSGGAPYPQDGYGCPQVWPQAVPPFDRQSTDRPSEVRGPGWTARILFWAALVIGALPEFVMMPMMLGGFGVEFFTLYSVGTTAFAILEVILGVLALLMVRASPKTMRLFGMSLYIFTSIYALVVPHMLPIIVNRLIPSFDLAMSIQSIVWAFHGGVVLAGTLIAWNLARNRAWWTHLVAAGYALLMGLVVAFVEWALNWFGSSFATSLVITQCVLLGVTFGGLGLLHLLGGLPSGTTLSFQATLPGLGDD